MVGTTRPRPERAPSRRFRRFDVVTRAVHWVNAALFAVLVVTGACLYFEPLAALVGRRRLVEEVHVWCGVALPVPVLIGVVGWWGRGLRSDLRRLNRWSADDRAWLRSTGQARVRRDATRRRLSLGKFNAGQKLNTAFTGGAIVVMLGTGAIMRWYHPWPLAWRTGATFVHDWLAFAIVLVIVGHVAKATGDPESLGSMLGGGVRRSWAARHAPAWLAELEALESGTSPPGP